MKEIRTEDAVGHILCHDITQIIKDVKKGVLFKKGHIVREEDIPLLLSVGKEHLQNKLEVLLDIQKSLKKIAINIRSYMKED